jgi:hypothetical protein
VPIAVRHLVACGVRLTSVQVAAHSLAGCFSAARFCGALVAKVLLAQTRRLPGWRRRAAR